MTATTAINNQQTIYVSSRVDDFLKSVMKEVQQNKQLDANFLHEILILKDDELVFTDTRTWARQNSPIGWSYKLFALACKAQ